MSDCTTSPYENITKPFSKLSGKYAKKTSPFLSAVKPYTKTTAYSKTLICPFLLDEDGFPILMEDGDRILLE